MVARTDKRVSGVQKWAAIDDALRGVLPHLASVLADEDDFLGMHIKPRGDGTTLAVVKRYNGDGTPMVCFGSGYGVAGCLMAADSAIQGDNWRIDKPWSPSSK